MNKTSKTKIAINIIFVVTLISFSICFVSSTTIKLQTADSQNLEDGQINQALPTADSGAYDSMGILPPPTYEYNSFFKFNISSIPFASSIDDSKLCLYLRFNNLDAGDNETLIVTKINSSYSWTENSINWNTQPTGNNITSTVSGDTNFINDTSLNNWICWNITTIVASSYAVGDSNLSLRVNTTAYAGNFNNLDYILFNSKEYATATLRPYLNITYTFINWSDNGSISQNVYGCGNLNTTNGIYTLISDINHNTPGGDCFNIGANNITINLNGKTISHYTEEGTYVIVDDTYNSTTLKNGVINNFSVSIASGGIDSLYNFNLNNLTINSASNGFYLNTIKNSNFNNIILTGGAITPMDCFNSLFNNVTISNSANGALVFSGGNNNTISNYNSINNDFGIYFSSSSSNSSNLVNNFLIKDTNGGFGIGIISQGSSNLFINGNITNSSAYDVYNTGTNTFNTFVNVTYNKAKEYISSGTLTRKWFVDVIINNTLGYLQNAAINITNLAGSNVFSALTNATGQISQQNLTEYTRTRTTTTYNTPHTINITKNEYHTNTTIYNATLQSNAIFNILLNWYIPEVNIDHPKPQFYYSNLSIPLNYSVSDPSIDTCWYKITNSSGSLIVNNLTIASCANTTFNIPRSGTYVLTLYANNSINNQNSSNVTFAVSLEAPAIVLNFPSNPTYVNNGLNRYFNFTTTDSDGLSVCQLWGDWGAGWHNNYTWIAPTNNTMNYTQVNIGTDGAYKWNIFCNDTLNTPNWGLNNFTFIVDSIKPNVTINDITTTTGSKIITFNSTSNDTYLLSCKYSIYNSLSVIDGANENISFSCSDAAVSGIVSAYDSYLLYVYAIDYAGNEQSTSKFFTVSTTTGPGGGGGSTTTIINNTLPTNSFCGDGICQSAFPGNDLGVVENFYSCSQDCEAFNIDTGIFSCFDGDPETQCVWDQNLYVYIGLGIAILLSILVFATVPDKRTGKQIPVYKYALKGFKNTGKNKIRYYRR